MGLCITEDRVELLLVGLVGFALGVVATLAVGLVVIGLNLETWGV